MKELTCATCSVKIYLPDDVYASRLSDGKSFYCVNGHSQVFAEPTEKKLQKRLDYYMDRCKRQEQEINTLRHATYGYKGALAVMRRKLARSQENDQ
jgi:hypothetical protein